MELMTQSENVWNKADDPRGEMAYNRAKHLGATMLRLRVGGTPLFDWSITDRFVDNTLAHGMKPYLTLDFSNRSTTQYGTFCGDAARRFNGRVFHYSVWNEPNASEGGDMPPETYHDLYVACRNAIKAVTPSANVYYGELAGGACTWLDLSLTSPTVTDGLAIHTYQWTTDPSSPSSNNCSGIGRLADWRQVLATHAITGRLRTPSGAAAPILVTEHGYCIETFICDGSGHGISEADRARYTPLAWNQAQARGATVFSYYHLVRNYANWDSGIVESDGTPLAAFDALRTAVGANRPYEGQPRWQPWDSLGGVLTAGTGAGANARSVNDLDVFVNGGGNALYQRNWTQPNIGWSPQWIGHNGAFNGDPASVSWSSDRVDTFVTGTDGGLYQKYWNAARGWSAWVSLGGQLTSSPAVASWGPGRLDVFARGTDSSLIHKSYDPVNGWSAWDSLGGVLTAAPAAVAWGPERLAVFTTNTGGSISFREFDTHPSYRAPGWGPWTHLDGQVVGGPAVSSWATGRLDLFVRTPQNRLAHRSYTPSSDWTGWDSLDGTIVSDPEAVSRGPGLIDVFAQSSDSALWHRGYKP